MNNNNNNRLFQLLSICYRYNKHYNTNRIWISVIGKRNAVIVYKQLINNTYMIRGYETNLDSARVMALIRDFYKTIPCYPEVCADEFETFPDFIQKSSCESKNLVNII